MAIYHYSAKVISRSSGSSAVAAAAYRSGEKIVDERTGEIHDYTRKKGVNSSWILAPESAPNWVFNREKLWNKVEAGERRKDSQLAREINVALPTELGMAQQLKLVRKFVNEQFISEGMVADISCHDLDSHNPHAHIMLTMREIDRNGFNAKKNRDWNKKELLEKQREAWATHTNKALEVAEINQIIDHRSLEAQGVEHIPQIHLGVAVNAMRKKGIGTEREDQYLEIEAANKEIREYKSRLESIDRLERSYQDSPEVENSPSSQEPSSEQKSVSSGLVSSEQQKQIVGIAKRFLQFVDSETWSAKRDDRNYSRITNKEGLLTIRANDGRGEVLRLQNEKIITQELTLKDVQQFEKISAGLDKHERAIANTAERFLLSIGLEVWNSETSGRDSTNYNIRNEKGLLTIEANDGRGKILHRQNEKVMTKGLTLKDVETFHKLSIHLNKESKQVESQKDDQDQNRRNRSRRSRR